jgi:hypothetical protein
MRIYQVRLRLNPLFVRVWANRWFDFEWTHILGVQIGPWFFGAVRGEVAKSIEAVSTEPPQRHAGTVDSMNIMEAAELAFEDILHALDEDMGCSLSETPVQLCCYWTGRADAPCGECERLKAAIVKAICGVRP